MFRFPKWVPMILIVITLGLVAARETRADEIIFSNFGPGMTYDTTTAWNVTGSNLFGGRVVAQSFTPSANFTFSNGKLAMGILSGPNILQVVLMTSSGGLPGTIIETIILTNAVPPLGPSGIVVANSALHPVLNNGVQYWIVAFAPEDDTFMGWNFSLNDSSFVLLNGFHSLTGPWDLSAPRSAFQIEGTVPEPATMVLLGTGLTAVAVKMRRRRKKQAE